MSVKFTECSVIKVRTDLGLPAGNTTDAKFRERCNKLTGTVSLEDYRGSVVGQHLTLDLGTWDNPTAWKKKKDESAAFFYISSQGGQAYIGGSRLDRWICRVQPTIAADRGSEIRGIGTISENGTFKLTGKAYGRFSASYPTAVRLDVQVIANSTGYLSGAQTVALNSSSNGTGGDRQITFNETVSLSTSQPYITLIARATGISGWSSSTTFSHEFWELQLKRVS
jgi:hypothetical protein